MIAITRKTRSFRFFSKNLIILFALFIFQKVAKAQSYGAAFASHEVFQDKRTSLDLGQDNFNFKGNFELSFDLAFIPQRPLYFGYIFRIIKDDKTNIDLVYNNLAKKNHFKLIVGDRLTNIAFDIDSANLYHHWVPIHIKFDITHNLIKFYNGRTWLVQSDVDLGKKGAYKILFGTNDRRQYQTSDTPPMNLKDIRITENNATTHYWPLKEDHGTIAHDLTGRTDGTIKNPVWISSLHHDWQPVRTMTVKGIASVAFNAQKEDLYIVANDSLYTYSVKKMDWDSQAYHTGIELDQGNQSLYVPSDHTLYDLLPDRRFVAGLDLSTNTWNKKFTIGDVTRYWHFNKFFSETDSAFYMIAGYGHLKYKNKIQRYHPASGTWNDVNITGDIFKPRYLAALGATAKGDTAYILGGLGNKSGLQILGAENTYDMMCFDVKRKTIRHLFDLNIDGEGFVFANSLVIDAQANTYYGLIFPQHNYDSNLQLIKGSLLRPEYHPLGGKIPFLFHDIHSFADLYYCPESKKLLAITLLRAENNTTTVNIYTLLTPVDQPQRTDQRTVSHTTYIVAMIVLIAGAISLWYFYFKKKKTLTISAPKTKVILSGIDEKFATNIPTDIAEVKEPILNSVFLFGNFQVFGADGSELTKLFSPLVKELFLIILLHNIKWQRGLSSAKLNEFLWRDKSAKSAKNNRSVNVLKLKHILEKMDHCQVSVDSGSWMIDMDLDRVYVDHKWFTDIISNNEISDTEKVEKLLGITSRGNFLSDIEFDWLDTYKSEIANDIVNTYLNYVKTHPDDLEMVIEICNAIFYFDPVNEDAVIIKCKALSALGKHTLARNAFENFGKDYQAVYDEPYFQDLNALLKSDLV